MESSFWSIICYGLKQPLIVFNNAILTASNRRTVG